MPELKATPGPWEITRNPFAEITGIRCSDGRQWDSNDPAHKFTGKWQGTEDERRSIVRARAEANAHLIAAAPALYEALEGLISFAENAEVKMLVGDEGCLWPVEFARVALKQARGEQ